MELIVLKILQQVMKHLSISQKITFLKNIHITFKEKL